MRGRFAVICVAVTGLVATALLIPLALFIGDFARDRGFSSAQAQAAAIEPVVVISTSPAFIRRSAASIGPTVLSRLAIYLTDASGHGQLLLGTQRASAADVNAAAVGARPVSVAVPGGYAVLQPVELSRERTAVIEVFLPAAQVSAGVTSSWVAMAGIAICLIAASVLVADRLAAPITGSARDLAAAANAMAAGDLSARSPVTGPAEIRSAAVVLNALAERLAQLLGTDHPTGPEPVSAEPASAEPASPEPASPERASPAPASAQPASLVPASEPAGCDAAEVLTERMESWSPRARREHRRHSLTGADRAAWVPVRREELAAAADALLGNIFRHTGDGTRFVVALHGGDNGVVITFADAGPGIAEPQEVLRQGSGHNGLQIARWVAESTGGELRIDRAPLGGTRVQMWLVTDPGPAQP